MNGMVFDIKHFAVNDGPGIRTAVFLKGCPLRCIWCHNPESQIRTPELLFNAEKCISCGRCRELCPNGLAPELCTNCGSCTAECWAEARVLAGRDYSVEEVMEEVMADVDFYGDDGGMTISGGEPLFQLEFTAELLAAAKKVNLHTCLDTSGFSAWSAFEKVLPFTDILLYDLKESDPEKHLEFTGVELEPILKNLYSADEYGADIILRCPLIPGKNMRSDHADFIAETANKLHNVREINLMPYHPLGEDKLRRLGRKSLFCSTFADKEEIEKFRTYLRQKTSSEVKIP